MSQITTKAALTKGREIAAGGEGKIYEHPTNKDMVIKLYHKPRKPEFVQHLEHLMSLSLAGAFTLRFVAPLNIYVDKFGMCLGFDMQYVNFNDYWLFNNLFNKGFCNNNGVDKAFKIKVLKQLSDCLDMLHKRDTIVGDLNQYNLFVSKKGEILFVDVDSYATKDSPHSGVLLDDIRDWTTMDINKETDIWAYDILSFWATTFCHPYKWVAPGNKESLEQRVKANKSILSRIPDIKIPALYEAPQGEVLKQFNEIFNGRRYMVDFTGVHVPVSTVVKQFAGSHTLIIRELYDHVTHINVCDKFFAFRTNDVVPKWTLVDSQIPKQVRVLFDSTHMEEIYPSNNTFAYRIGNELCTHDGKWTKIFVQPTWDYNDGCLTVIDYATDMQWNFNINNQLAGIDCTSTPVFAKSIIKRTGNIQNFGSQKFLNAPMNNRYTLIPIPQDTKDSFKVKNYIAIERKKQSKTFFTLSNTMSIGNSPDISLDYLPKFAVTIDNKGVVLIPDDGFIQVYVKGQWAMKFDCGVCTQNSELYCTTAGILMLESNQLYLLNTK